jgi:oxygen-independent coproporphyrinogen-3 oxidase
VPIYNWIYPLTARRTATFEGVRRANVFQEIGRRPQIARALYFHIPFCETICSFCPFVRGRFSDNDVVELYAQALIKEIRFKAPLIGAVPITAIFFGGGTPSLLNAEQIRRIGKVVRDNFDLSLVKEFSFEFEVKSITDEKLQALQEIGVTHARFGAQTFNEEYRDLFSLTATIDQIRNGASKLKAAFPFTSCDLMYGMNGQTAEEFVDDVRSAASLGLNNLDFYPINNAVTQLKLHTAFRKGGLTATSGMTKYYMNSLLRELLAGHGYMPHNGHGYVKVDPTEISSGAVVTQRYTFAYHEHVYGYEGHDVIGFGVNAISSTSRFTIFNGANRERYIRNILQGDEYDFTVCEHDREIDAAKPIAMRLPYHGSVDCDRVDWPAVPGDVKRALDELLDFGLIQQEARTLKLTRSGWHWYVNIMHYLLPQKERNALDSLIDRARVDPNRSMEDSNIPAEFIAIQ